PRTFTRGVGGVHPWNSLAVHPLGEGEFVGETLAEVGVVGVFGSDHFHRGRVVVVVEPQVHAAHTAVAQEGGDLVGADPGGVVVGEGAHGGLGLWHGERGGQLT